MTALAPFLTVSIERLRQAGIDNPPLDARLLFCHALDCDRAQLLSQSGRILNPEEIAAIETLLLRREQHESVARIIGFREFWGLEFGLNEATLEPRPDSETLVEAVLNSLPLAGGLREGGVRQENRSKDEKDLPASNHSSLLTSFRLPPLPNPPREGEGISLSLPLRILDLGTGTGCLLLSLLHEMPQATGVGIDLAPRAVEQAKKNAEKLGLNSRAEFRIGNWFEPISLSEKFDIIISNPPYIASSDIAGLMPDVRKHDPLAALDGGMDGLTPYRLLIPQLKNFLKPNGLAAFEFGQGQAVPVVDLLKQAGFADIALHKDLGGIERCVTAWRRDL